MFKDNVKVLEAAEEYAIAHQKLAEFRQTNRQNLGTSHKALKPIREEESRLNGIAQRMKDRLLMTVQSAEVLNG